MGKIKTFTMSTFTLPFFAAPSTFTATSCAKSLPSFAAPNTSFATSCAPPQKKNKHAESIEIIP